MNQQKPPPNTSLKPLTTFEATNVTSTRLRSHLSTDETIDKVADLFQRINAEQVKMLSLVRWLVEWQLRTTLTKVNVSFVVTK